MRLNVTLSLVASLNYSTCLKPLLIVSKKSELTKPKWVFKHLIIGYSWC